MPQLQCPHCGEEVSYHDLSPRQVEILRLMAEGLTNRGIAHRLGIAEMTAKNHITHIYDKLGVGCRVSAVREAERLGIVHIH